MAMLRLILRLQCMPHASAARSRDCQPADWLVLCLQKNLKTIKQKKKEAAFPKRRYAIKA